MANDKQNAWIERVLSFRPGVWQDMSGPATRPPSLDELGLDSSDVWKAARAAFGTAAQEVDAQIASLQAELRASEDPDLNEIAELGLNAMTGNTRVPLQAAIHEAGDGDPKQLLAGAPKLRSAIGAFRKQLTSDARIAACDANPFHVEVSILATYDIALQQMLDALDAI